MLFSPLKIKAARGCCSHHGGVSGCSSSGRQICQDGTLSPTCTCTPVVNYVYGCTDKTAKNYNINARFNQCPTDALGISKKRGAMRTPLRNSMTACNQAVLPLAHPPQSG